MFTNSIGPVMKNFLRRFVLGGLPILLLVAGNLSAQGGTVLPNQTILPPQNPPTEVAIVVKVPVAYAAAGTPGSFRITRTGNLLGDVTIRYRVSGLAVPGQDYQALEGTLTIPASRSGAVVRVRPLSVAGSAGTVKRVRVTLLEGDGYSVGAASKAKVKIVQ